MKKTVALALALLLCVGAMFSGCTPSYSKSPDQYKEIRWISYDYSFCIKPADDCTGYYTFDGKKYNIKVNFDASHLTAVDTDNNNTELFNADWKYEDNENGDELLYIYNIAFNTKDYEALKTDYAEFVNLKQEKL